MKNEDYKKKYQQLSKKLLSLNPTGIISLEENCFDKVSLKLIKLLRKHLNASGVCLYSKHKSIFKLKYKTPLTEFKISFKIENEKEVDYLKENKGAILVKNNLKNFPFFKTFANFQENINYILFPIFTKLKNLLGIFVLKSKPNQTFNESDIYLGNVILQYFCDMFYKDQISKKFMETELEYSNLINTLPVGIYRTNQKGEILFANKKLAEILGFDNVNELKKFNVHDFFVNEKEREMQIKNWKQSGSGVNIFKLKNIHGEEIWIRDTGIVYNKGKKNQFFEGSMEDISELRETEEIYSLLYKVIEQMNESLLISNFYGDIEYVNPAFEKQTGYTIDEVVGKNPSILKSGEHDTKYYKNLWDTIISGQIWSGELINKDKSGKKFVEYAVILPIKNMSGNITHFAAVKRNITKERKLEEQLHQSQKMESIGRLAGGIAHDFNNLLTVITGYSDLLMHGKNPGSTEWKQLSTILQSAETAQKLTKQLLAFSRHDRIESKQIKIDKTILKLKSMLERLIEEDIELKFNLNCKNTIILADEQQLQQVLINLTVNAKDALIHKKIKKITISTENVHIIDNYLNLPEGDYIRLTISDTGKGIPKEIINNIFEPFFTTKDKDKGTGLGLATVYGIVKQNNGTIEVNSEIDVGTNFIVYWPIVNEDDIFDEYIKDVDSESFEGNEFILLVEDEETVRVVTEDILKTLGYTVISCKNGEEAFELYKKNKDKIDLVMTDVTMPVMNGQELAYEIRQINPDIKILFSSGYALKIKELQNENFIRKPYNLKDLSIVISNILNSDN